MQLGCRAGSICLQTAKWLPTLQFPLAVFGGVHLLMHQILLIDDIVIFTAVKRPLRIDPNTTKSTVASFLMDDGNFNHETNDSVTTCGRRLLNSHRG